MNVDLNVIAYSVYLLVSVCMTIWVARSLSRHGDTFLEASFHDARVAKATNHMLVVGFYILNFGLICLVLGIERDLRSTREVIEMFSANLGKVLLLLGTLHMVNLAIFDQIRRRGQFERGLPAQPDGSTPVVQGGEGA